MILWQLHTKENFLYENFVLKGEEGDLKIPFCDDVTKKLNISNNNLAITSKSIFRSQVICDNTNNKAR
jgi:hypothetical protein